MLSSSNNAALPFSFSAKAYFSHFSLKEMPTVSLDGLTTIITHHLANFLYLNSQLYRAGKLPVTERQIPSLETDYLYNLMLENKGGYCFQNIELMHAVLTDVGFNIERHLANAIFKTYDKFDISNLPSQTKTHELLIITLDDKRYIIDVGMGDSSLRKPILLTEGEFFIGGDYYRLSQRNDTWILDTKSTPNEPWLCVYLFHNTSDPIDAVKYAHDNLFTTDEHLDIRDDMELIGKTTEKNREYLMITGTNFGIFRSYKSYADTDINPLTMKFDDEVTAREFARQNFQLSAKNV